MSAVEQKHDVLVRCSLCGAYELAPSAADICLDCARELHHARTRAEAQGGRLLAIDGAVHIYSRAFLATPDGLLAYHADVHIATAMSPRPVTYLGAA